MTAALLAPFSSYGGAVALQVGKARRQARLCLALPSGDAVTRTSAL